MAGGALIVATGWTGIGTVVGAVMILNGLDNTVAGVRGLASGEYKQAFLEAAIHAFVPNSTVSDVLYMATQFAIPAGGLKVNTTGVRGVPAQTSGVSSMQKGICFAAGTLVATSQGLRPIEDILPGDLVLAKDESTGETAWQPVRRLFVTPDQPTLELTLGEDSGLEDTFQVTPEHPFWVGDKGWVEAGDLLPGDEVYTSSGGWVKVKGSSWTSRRQTVYNFEVANFHTYFVGKTGAWVHNSCQVTSGPGGLRPGQFAAEDVAFGLTRPGGKPGGLLEFAGKAVPGTRAPLSGATRAMAPGAARNAAIANDTLQFARQTLNRTGGNLRFNLQGFDVPGALRPGSPVYNSITSAEFRGILGDPFLRGRTTFYRGGIDVTTETLRAAGVL